MLMLFAAALSLIVVLTPVDGEITHECSYVNGKAINFLVRLS